LAKAVTTAPRRSGRLHRPAAAWTLPEMRRPRVRAADELPVRARHRPGEDLRLPLGQGDPAAADRAGADGKAAQRGAHRRAARVHFKSHTAQVFRFPGTQADGTVGFEFEPRAKTAAKAAARTRAAAPEEQTPALAARTTKSASARRLPARTSVRRRQRAPRSSGPVRPRPRTRQSAAKRATKTAARKATKSAG